MITPSPFPACSGGSAGAPALATAGALPGGFPESEQAARELLAWAAHLDTFPETKSRCSGASSCTPGRGRGPVRLRPDATAPRRLGRHDGAPRGGQPADHRADLGVPADAAKAAGRDAPDQPERLTLQVQHELVSVTAGAFPGRTTPRAWTSSPSWPGYGNAARGRRLLHLQRRLGTQRAGARIIGGFSLTGHGEGRPARTWLVTPDEVGDPRALEVPVTIDGTERCRGSTARSAPRRNVIRWLETICPLAPARDRHRHDPIAPGSITTTSSIPAQRSRSLFARLGTLRYRFAEPRAGCCRADGRCER